MKSVAPSIIIRYIWFLGAFFDEYNFIFHEYEEDRQWFFAVLSSFYETKQKQEPNEKQQQKRYEKQILIDLTTLFKIR